MKMKIKMKMKKRKPVNKQLLLLLLLWTVYSWPVRYAIEAEARFVIRGCIIELTVIAGSGHTHTLTHRLTHKIHSTIR